MKTYRLSKSQYTKAVKCLKAIWLYRHNKDLAEAPSAFQQNIFDQGHEVGLLATKLFKGGVMIAEDHTQPQEALAKTKQVLQENPPAIFEAAFEYNNVLVRVDVLKNNNDGTWDLIEVKSTSEVKEKIHYDDVAIQKYVLVNAGIKLKNSYLMHLNKDYIKKGELDLKQLFSKSPLDDKIESNYQKIEDNLKLIQAHLNNPKPPNELIGSKCKNPYDCEFKSHCWAEAKPGTIHTIGRIKDPKRHELMDRGILNIKDIPDDFKLSANQKIEVEAAKKNDIAIDLKKIRKHLSKLKYPLYFLDYESASYAVPRYDGSWPHKHLVSQYSLHIQEKPDAEIIHKEYLYDDKGDPSKALATQLLKDIKEDGGSIIVYHETYERERTKELAKALPELENRLNDLINRMWDLETPFAKRWYWDPKFNGSSSIKAVLPVFAPKLNYDDLEIQKGDTAQLEYARMIELPNDSIEREQIKNNLLEYCKRDTYAMVVILKMLSKGLDS